MERQLHEKDKKIFLYKGKEGKFNLKPNKDKEKREYHP
jgi:hypothetical protein